jgi:hypothetical protein
VTTAIVAARRVVRWALSHVEQFRRDDTLAGALELQIVQAVHDGAAEHRRLLREASDYLLRIDQDMTDSTAAGLARSIERLLKKEEHLGTDTTPAPPG